MTIRELKDRVPYVKGIVKLPSPKGLREADIPIIADTDDSLETCLGEECRAVVYMNGLVLYTRGKGYCEETDYRGDSKLFNVDRIAYEMMNQGMNISWIYPEMPVVANEIESRRITV